MTIYNITAACCRFRIPKKIIISEIAKIRYFVRYIPISLYVTWCNRDCILLYFYNFLCEFFQKRDWCASNNGSTSNANTTTNTRSYYQGVC